MSAGLRGSVPALGILQSIQKKATTVALSRRYLIMRSMSIPQKCIVSNQLPHPAALLQRNRHLLDNLQSEALQGRNVHGGIRQPPEWARNQRKSRLGKTRRFSRNRAAQVRTASTSSKPPASFSICSNTISILIAGRYGRWEPIASTMSATARTLASGKIASPLRPRG